jgi:hypothetical protein
MSKPPRDRPFNWFTKTHLRYARQGRYRDVFYLDRYYNPAMDKFVSKGGKGLKGQDNKDLYRSTYANGRLTPPKGYMFDVAKAELVPSRRLRKGNEVFHDGLIYRGEHLMREFMPTTRVREVAAAADGRYTLELALYGRRHPTRKDSKLGEGASKKLSVFGRPLHRVGRANNELMHGEQVVLRELRSESLDISAQEFAGFKRKPQENRLYLLNTDDFDYLFKLCVKHGISIDKSMFLVAKIVSVAAGRMGGPAQELDEPM